LGPLGAVIACAQCSSRYCLEQHQIDIDVFEDFASWRLNQSVKLKFEGIGKGGRKSTFIKLV